ncbi:hypothetical protein D6817_01060 [Candidatus Pacearchaeota archaeon]|nr:MAG: hypothetical protein D6817_01060 [Candidatus Pacearchaeota archaeon]
MELTPISKRVKKKGALELSIGTIVIVVLAMSMLILGLVLVRKIFSTSTGWVTDINGKVKGELAKLFNQRQAKVAIVGVSGPDNTVEIEAGGEAGIAIGARTENGEQIDKRDSMKLTLSLGNSGRGTNCGDSVFNYITNAEKEAPRGLDRSEGDKAYWIIHFQVPEGTVACTQQISVKIENTINNKVYFDSFNVKIKPGGGLFG